MISRKYPFKIVEHAFNAVYLQMPKINLDCRIYGAGSFVSHDIKLTGHHTDFKWVWRKSDAKVIVLHHRAHSCGEGDGELLHERGEEEEQHHPGQVLSQTQPPTYETGGTKRR